MTDDDDKDSALNIPSQMSEESPSQRAERILQICNIVEDSGGRVTEATKCAIRELDSPQAHAPLAEQITEFPRYGDLPTFIETSNEDGHDECVGDDSNFDAYSVRSTYEIGRSQLEEKLKRCQIALIKVKENCHLKYVRLESEHNRMNDKYTSIKSKVENMKTKLKEYLTERDEAKNKVTAIMETHRSIIDRINEENDQLEEELLQLHESNEKLTKQRERYNEMLDNCTCREIEMDEVFQRPQPRRESSTLSSSTKRSSLKSLFSRGSSIRSNEISNRRGSEYSRRGSDCVIDYDNDGYLY